MKRTRLKRKTGFKKKSYDEAIKDFSIIIQKRMREMESKRLIERSKAIIAWTDLNTPVKGIGNKLKPVSTKRAKELRLYSKLRKEYLESNFFCEMCKAGSSEYNPLEIHHKIGREKDILNDVSKWMAVHRFCHSWIHANPKWSYKMGYLIRDSKELREEGNKIQ